MRTATRSAALAMAFACATAADVLAQGPQETVDVQILAVNDFHGNLAPPAGSSGRVGAIDAGGVDTWQLTSISSEPVIPTRSSSLPAT